jgi:hypothetical protein
MQQAKPDFEAIITHDETENCIPCRAQELTMVALVPAAAAWEMTSGLPRFSMALHGAAGLLGSMLEEGVAREDIEHALSHLLDDIEQQIAEDGALAGPALGNA